MQRTLAQIISEEFNGSALQYYVAKHKNKPRGRLKKDEIQLWRMMHRGGSIKHVPSLRQNFGDDILMFCMKKHPKAKTRYALQQENESAYNRVRREGLLGYFETADRRDVTLRRSRIGKNSLIYYKKHCDGDTRGELKIKDPGLYKRMLTDGNIIYVPTALEKKLLVS